MWFWSGSTVKETEITDVKSYNRENGIMWIGYSLVLWLGTIMGAFNMAAAGIVLHHVYLIKFAKKRDAVASKAEGILLLISRDIWSGPDYRRRCHEFLLGKRHRSHSKFRHARKRRIFLPRPHQDPMSHSTYYILKYFIIDLFHIHHDFYLLNYSNLFSVFAALFRWHFCYLIDV